MDNSKTVPTPYEPKHPDSLRLAIVLLNHPDQIQEETKQYSADEYAIIFNDIHEIGLQQTERAALQQFETAVQDLLIKQIQAGTFELPGEYWTHELKGGVYTAAFDPDIMVKTGKEWRSGFVRYYKLALDLDEDGFQAIIRLRKMFLRPAQEFLAKFRQIAFDERRPILEAELENKRLNKPTKP